MVLRKTTLALGVWGLSAGLACSAVEPEVAEAGSGTEGSSGTGSDDSEPSVPANPSAGETGMTGDGTAADSEMPTTAPADDSTSDTTAGTSDTDDCPAGTEDCPCGRDEQCDEGLECNGDGVCEPPPPCMPIDLEPHGDEATAAMLTELDCNESMSEGLIATVDGTETDWYRYFGNHDLAFCNEEPGATVTSDVPLEVCVFVDCDSGNTQNVECAGENTMEMSPDGRPGCCGTDSADMTDYGCSSIANDDANVWISVSSRVPVCAHYELSYEF